MTFRNRLQYLLVKKLQISNKRALEIILSKEVMLNGTPVSENLIIESSDEVIYQGEVLKEGKKMVYYAYYKPRGIETTLNPEIADNLKDILPFEEPVFPVGRLDKASEGLLILTNDGSFFDKTLRKEHHTEKEYRVKTDKIIDEHFISSMAGGITIMGKTTLPCPVFKIDDCTFKIILVQGLNRQIRRMCYKLHYEVTELIRIRVGNVLLEDLKPGEFRDLGSKPV
jgi:23S rRNA pseudouridine2604 synthase